MVGNEARKTSRSKNERLTAGQPCEVTTRTTTSAMKTTVLATAIATPRPPSAPRPPRILERRSPTGSGVATV